MQESWGKNFLGVGKNILGYSLHFLSERGLEGGGGGEGKARRNG